MKLGKTTYRRVIEILLLGALSVAFFQMTNTDFLKGTFSIYNLTSSDPTTASYIHLPDMDGKVGDLNFDTDSNGNDDAIVFYIYAKGEQDVYAFQFDLEYPEAFENDIAGSVDFSINSLNGAASDVPNPPTININTTTNIISFGDNTNPVFINFSNPIPAGTKHPIAEITINRALDSDDIPGYTTAIGNNFKISNTVLHYFGNNAFTLPLNNIFDGDLTITSNLSSTATIESFSLTPGDQTVANQSIITTQIDGTIDQVNTTITLIVPHGTDVSNLYPTVTTGPVGNEALSIGTGTPTSYTSGNTYVGTNIQTMNVEAQDGTLIPYDVTIYVLPTPPIFTATYQSSDTILSRTTATIFTGGTTVTGSCEPGATFQTDGYDVNSSSNLNWTNSSMFLANYLYTINGKCIKTINGTTPYEATGSALMRIDSIPPVISTPANSNEPSTSSTGGITTSDNVINITVDDSYDTIGSGNVDTDIPTTGTNTAKCQLGITPFAAQVLSNNLTVIIPSGTSLNSGPNIFSCSAQDANGNQATTQSFTITVADNEGPTLTIYENGSPTTSIIADAVDANGGDVTYSVRATDNVTPMDQISIECTGTDKNGATLLTNQLFGPATSTTDPQISFSSINYPYGISDLKCTATDQASNVNTPSFLDTTTADGAVSHYSFDETSGSTVYDKIGTRDGVILDNSTNVLPGVFSTDGIDNGSSIFSSNKRMKISIANINNLQEGTIEMIIKNFSTTSTGYSELFTSTNGRKIVLKNDGITLAASGWLTGQTCQLSQSLNSSTFHHFIYTYDKSEGKAYIYLDSNLECTINISSGDQVLEGATGNYYIPNAQPTLTIDEFALYPHTLNAQQVQNHYSYITSSSTIGTPYTIELVDNEDPTITYTPVSAQSINQAAGSNSTNETLTITPGDNVSLPEDVELTCDNPNSILDTNATDPMILTGSTSYTFTTINFPIGNTTITCTATDEAQNTYAEYWSITVNTMNAPQITMPLTQTLTLDGNGQATLSTVTVSATDIETDDNFLTISCFESDNAGTLISSPLYWSGNGNIYGRTTTGASQDISISSGLNSVDTFYITCTATDLDSLTSTGTFEIEMIDITPPVITGSNTINIDYTTGGDTIDLSFGVTDNVSDYNDISFYCDSDDTTQGSNWINAATLNNDDTISFPSKQFVVGQTTTLSCYATDTANNTNSSAFEVAITVNADGTPTWVSPTPTDGNTTTLNTTNGDTITTDGSIKNISIKATDPEDTPADLIVSCLNQYSSTNNFTSIAFVSEATGTINASGEYSIRPSTNWPFGYTQITCTAADTDYDDQDSSTDEHHVSTSFIIFVEDDVDPTLTLSSPYTNNTIPAADSSGASGVQWIVDIADPQSTTMTLDCTWQRPSDIAQVSFVPFNNGAISISTTNGTAQNTYTNDFEIGTTQITCETFDQNGNSSGTQTLDILVTADGTPSLIVTAQNNSLFLNFNTYSIGQNTNSSGQYYNDNTPGVEVVIQANPDDTDSAFSQLSLACSIGGQQLNGIVADNTNEVWNITHTFPYSPTDHTAGYTSGIECIVTDEANHTATGTESVTLIDNIAPTLTLPTIPAAIASSVSGAEFSFSVNGSNYSDNYSSDGDIILTCFESFLGQNETQQFQGNPAYTVTNQNYPIGGTTLRCEASDQAGNTIGDVTPISTDITVNPSGTIALTLSSTISYPIPLGTGTTATETITATPTDDDTLFGDLTLTCTDSTLTISPNTQAETWSITGGFSIGNTVVDCSVLDLDAHTASDTHVVQVADTTPPTIIEPNNYTDVGNKVIQAEATESGGAWVNWSISASDNIPDLLGTNIECKNTAGSVTTWNGNGFGTLEVNANNNQDQIFALGDTFIKCKATDDSGNNGYITTGTYDFTIQVVDTQSPTLTNPGDQTLAANNNGEASQSFTIEPQDIDDVDLFVSNVCTLTGATTGSHNNNGQTIDTLSFNDTFSMGDTLVTCEAEDEYDNSTTSTYTVTVEDQGPPTVHVPADIITNANTTGGANIGSATVTATDNIDHQTAISITCVSSGVQTGLSITSFSPLTLSNEFFGLGISTLNCTATDTSSNTGSDDFDIQVVDQDAPTIDLPNDMFEYTTSPSGKAISFVVIANDPSDGPLPVTCDFNSGDSFPIGTTLVTCTATDSVGHSTSGDFSITVELRSTGRSLKPKATSKTPTPQPSPVPSTPSESGGDTMRPSPAIDNHNNSLCQAREDTADVHDVFPDVEVVSWAPEYIQKLYDVKAVNGYKDGTIRLTSNTTRAEFIKMLFVASCETLESYENTPFRDVTDTENWQFWYVANAYHKGYINGYDDGTFKPNRFINRSEAMKIMMAVEGYDSAWYQATYPEHISFNDLPDNTWIERYVGYAHVKGYTNGYDDGTFKPFNDISRAETSKLIVTIFEEKIEEARKVLYIEE